MNQSNALCGDAPKEPPREWNSQPPEAHFKSRTSTSRTNPLISTIMGELNHHSIDNGDVKIPTSEFLVESKYESVPDPDTTKIKSIDDDEMENSGKNALLKYYRNKMLAFFHIPFQ